MVLITIIYKLTGDFPKEELYGLSSQMRRCAVSTASNLAEGAARNSTKDFLRFISISYGSLAELETQLIIAMNLRYLKKEEFEFLENEIIEIGRMLNGLEKALQRKMEQLTTNH